MSISTLRLCGAIIAPSLLTSIALAAVSDITPTAPPEVLPDRIPPSAPAPLPEGVRVIITEIMYNPASEEGRGQAEWVEIANVGTAPIDITDWRLDDEDARPSDQWGAFSCRLLPGQAAVLVNGADVSEEEFRRAWDLPQSEDAAEYLVIGVKWGNLANTPSPTNEILVLRDAEERVVCEVNLSSGGGWPRIAGLGGPSIFLTDLDATDLNDGSLWSKSVEGEHGAVAVRPTEVFGGADIGSPGRLPKRRPASASATGSGPGTS